MVVSHQVTLQSLMLPICRVGRRVLLHSECIVLLHSFKARNVLLRSFELFFEFLATDETQKKAAFFWVLFLRM